LPVRLVNEHGTLDVAVPQNEMDLAAGGLFYAYELFLLIANKMDHLCVPYHIDKSKIILLELAIQVPSFDLVVANGIPAYDKGILQYLETVQVIGFPMVHQFDGIPSDLAFIRPENRISDKLGDP
jgi:hypothetical protein